MSSNNNEYSSQIIKEMDCPFCKEGKIKVHYRPPMRQFKVSRIAAKTARVPYMSKEKYEVISEKCLNCGKTRAEMERRLKEGKQPSREDVIKRMKEAGLDPTKLK